MHVHVHMHIHVKINTCKVIYKYMHMRVRVHAYVHACVCMCMYLYMFVCWCMYMCVQSDRTCLLVRARASDLAFYMQTTTFCPHTLSNSFFLSYTHTHTHTHTQTHTHMHIYIYTCIDDVHAAHAQEAGRITELQKELDKAMHEAASANQSRLQLSEALASTRLELTATTHELCHESSQCTAAAEQISAAQVRETELQTLADRLQQMVASAEESLEQHEEQRMLDLERQSQQDASRKRQWTLERERESVRLAQVVTQMSQDIQHVRHEVATTQGLLQQQREYEQQRLVQNEQERTLAGMSSEAQRLDSAAVEKGLREQVTTMAEKEMARQQGMEQVLFILHGCREDGQRQATSAADFLRAAEGLRQQLQESREREYELTLALVASKTEAKHALAQVEEAAGTLHKSRSSHAILEDAVMVLQEKAAMLEHTVTAAQAQAASTHQHNIYLEHHVCSAAAEAEHMVTSSIDSIEVLSRALDGKSSRLALLYMVSSFCVSVSMPVLVSLFISVPVPVPLSVFASEHVPVPLLCLFLSLIPCWFHCRCLHVFWVERMCAYRVQSLFHACTYRKRRRGRIP